MRTSKAFLSIIVITSLFASCEEDDVANNHNNNNNNNNSTCVPENCNFGECINGNCDCGDFALAPDCDSTIFEKFYRDYDLECGFATLERPSPDHDGGDHVDCIFTIRGVTNYGFMTVSNGAYGNYLAQRTIEGANGIWNYSYRIGIDINLPNQIYISVSYSTNDPGGLDAYCDSTFVLQ